MKVEFTKEMRQTHTILAPNMLGIHFELLKHVFRINGYNFEICTNDGANVVNAGLELVHNDTCYPALLVIGQLIDTLRSGKYDINKVALMVPQTGGGCRASNYIHLLRKALEKAGYPQVPVISLNLSGMEKNSGFTFTVTMIRQAMMTLAYGDLMMFLDNQIKPYEVEVGSSRRVIDKWVPELAEQFKHGKGFTRGDFKKNTQLMAQDFAKIEMDTSIKKVKVGIVGEIYAKYSKLANNHLEEFLFSQGCEVNVPGIVPFMLFKIDNRRDDVVLYDGNKLKKMVATVLFDYVEGVEADMIESIRAVGKFKLPTSYRHIRQLVDGVIGYGNKMGEGWFLVAEMMELAESGYGNIVCCQPFGCLPNHIVGKGMTRSIKKIFPNANIVPIDYDPGATKVNQENRIKLMLSNASYN
jgi:predicted nucleotide-binding protein (sugar kinase/HSP70/actin superfamily)